MILRLAFLMLLFFPPSDLFCQEIYFIGEDLTFGISTDYFRVRGTYYFLNPSNRPVDQSIFYPIGGDGAFDILKVIDVGKSREERIVSTTNHGCTFIVHADGGDTAVYYIEYRQRLTSDSAVYLLTTTRRWRRPLGWATYTLVEDQAIPIVSFSYPPDTLYHIQQSTIYRWQKRDFLPEKEMIFHFKIP